MHEPALPYETSWESLEREYRHFGYSIEEHPLGLLRPALKRSNELMRPQGRPLFIRSDELESLPHKKVIKVAGLLSLLQRPPTAKGACFVTLEDECGSIPLILAPAVYQQCRLLLSDHHLIWAEGTLCNISGVINVQVRKVQPLPLERMSLQP